MLRPENKRRSLIVIAAIVTIKGQFRCLLAKCQVYIELGRHLSSIALCQVPSGAFGKRIAECQVIGFQRLPSVSLGTCHSVILPGKFMSVLPSRTGLGKLCQVLGRLGKNLPGNALPGRNSERQTLGKRVPLLHVKCQVIQLALDKQWNWPQILG